MKTELAIFAALLFSGWVFGALSAAVTDGHLQKAGAPIPVDQSAHIEILGKVEAIKAVGPRFPVKVGGKTVGFHRRRGLAVTLRVIYALPGTQLAGHTVVISGNRFGSLNNWGVVPTTKLGEIVCWEAVGVPRQGLTFLDGCSLPIDFDASLPVAPSHVGELVQALKAARLAPPVAQGGKLITNRQALAFWHSKNYFLWSLGAYWLSEMGKDREIRRLMHVYRGNSLRKVLWVNTMMRIITNCKRQKASLAAKYNYRRLIHWLRIHFPRRQNPPGHGSPKFRPNPTPQPFSF